jgi:hypothetical protein
MQTFWMYGTDSNHYDLQCSAISETTTSWIKEQMTISDEIVNITLKKSTKMCTYMRDFKGQTNCI